MWFQLGGAHLRGSQSHRDYHRAGGQSWGDTQHLPRSWLWAFSWPSKYSRLYPLQSLFMPTGHMGSWSVWLCFTRR